MPLQMLVLSRLLSTFITFKFSTLMIPNCLIVIRNLITILDVQNASEVFLNNIKNDNAPACTKIDTLNHDYITYADP